MKIHQNIGDLDFVIRLLLLFGFFYLAKNISSWFYLLVAWEIFVLSNKWCIVYDLLKISTVKKK